MLDVLFLVVVIVVVMLLASRARFEGLALDRFVRVSLVRLFALVALLNSSRARSRSSSRSSWRRAFIS